MARILILIAGLVVAIYLWAWLKSRYQLQGRPFAIKATLVGCALLFIALAGAGKIHWLGAVLASTLAAIRFFLPILFRSLPILAPFLKRANADQAKAKADDDSDMTKEEAFAILGLDNTATEEEIVMAHRRLIQKLHPDTGGNEYLATQLNLAKDVLINP